MRPVPPTPTAVTVSVSQPAVATPVSATILGQNLEVHTRSVTAMLSDRLENPTFAGPPADGGLAPPWRPRHLTPRMSLVRWVRGVGLSGDGVHHLVNYHASGANGIGIVQTHRQIRAGEDLVVEVWARTRHQPSTLAVSLSPAARIADSYAQATVLVDSTYWKRYRLDLTVPIDDDHAVFEFGVEGMGQLFVDQIHLRAAGEGDLSSAAVQAVAALRVPALRFPGGSRAASYRWRDGTGPTHLRPAITDEAHHYLRVHDFGTDEYLSMCHDQQITPHITVNLGSATPDEAAEWAAHVRRWYDDRGIAQPSAYFQIGNEDWGEHEYSHMSPQMYTAALRDYVPGIREAYPRARIIANVEKDTQTLIDDGPVPWRSKVLDTVKDLDVEVVAIHLYKGRIRDDPQAQQRAVVDALDDVADDIAGLAHDLDVAGVTSGIAITEWNYLTDAAQHDGAVQLERSGPMYLEPYDARHCLFIAGMIHRLARFSPRLELANFYNLISPYGVLRRYGLEVEETPAAHVFGLYRDALPGELLDVTVRSGSTSSEEWPRVDALALQSDGVVRTFLVNLDPYRTVDVTVDGLPVRPTSGVILSATTPTDEPKRARFAVDGNGPVVVPPLSVVRVR